VFSDSGGGAENPRVGSSILSLATILCQALTVIAESLGAAMFQFCFHSAPAETWKGMHGVD